jgi:Domain of unknown function (DUF6438)
MKRFFFSAVLLCSMALAGELASLHQTMPKQVEPESLEKDQGLELPDGVGLAPGIKLAGPSVRPDPGIDEIGIERTRCLSNCPAYTLIIQKDGSFRYSGEYGVERLGDYTGKVSVGQLNQVMRFINEALFFAFDTSYTTPFLDGPTTYTMAKKGNDLKVIENYASSGPATLWAIEQLMDSLLETAEWND